MFFRVTVSWNLLIFALWFTRYPNSIYNTNSVLLYAVTYIVAALSGVQAL